MVAIDPPGSMAATSATAGCSTVHGREMAAPLWYTALLLLTTLTIGR
jgi:hypothetical protein